jgi:Ice-binding-like
VVQRGRFLVVVITLALTVVLPNFSALVPANASSEPILLSAGNFQILSGAAVTLGASITGLDPANAGTSAGAVTDLSNAIATLSSASATPVAADLGGKTYIPGSYIALAGTAFTMTSSIVIDGLNDCNSKFIFVTPAAMNTTAGISMTLINDAKASNIYWVSGAAITIGASNNISGNFLSGAAVTVGASTSVNGRFLGVAAVTVGASVTFQGFPLIGCSKPLGALSISVPAALNAMNINPGDTLNLEMSQVVVTDTRGLGAPWAVDVQISSLKNGAGDQLGGQFFSYSMKELTSLDGATLASHALTSMLFPAVILNATSGSTGASWIPLIAITVPQDQQAGTYTGLIKHSVY